MASNETVAIEPASALSPDNAGSNVTEAIPLVVKNITVKRSPRLLRRFQKSVIIKSKAANIILIWSVMVHLLYGFLLNPDTVFVVSIPFVSNALLSNIGGIMAIINIIGSAAYGIIAVWLLFYPLAGYLADVHYGRYRVVIFGLRFIWFGLLLLIIGVGAAIGILVLITDPKANLYNPFTILFTTIVTVGYSVFFAGLIIITYFIWSIGFAAFAANVIQFGIDQLQDFPSRDSFLFIHWLLLTQYIGVGIGNFLWSAVTATFFVSLSVFGLVFLFLIFALPVSLCIVKSKWFITDTGIKNPYREVAQVVSFARRHKIPIQRSAFTYWEDDIPAGLDLGKSKYGGPFTTEQVENVKAFFGILCIYSLLGLFSQLTLLQRHFFLY